MKYLVIFTTPVEGGWRTEHIDAVAVVEADPNNFSMPYGWQPHEIAGLAVDEVRYIVPIPTGWIGIISGEYDTALRLDMSGETAIIINDQGMEENNGQG